MSQKMFIQCSALPLSSETLVAQLLICTTKIRVLLISVK